MSKFFRYPFAISGQRTDVPDIVDPYGYVSYEQGYGPDYSADPGNDPDAKNIARLSWNGLIYAITDNIRQYQTFSVPEFITSLDNGGSPFSYSRGARVRYDAGSGYNVYVSLIDSNTNLPIDTNSWEIDLAYSAGNKGDVTIATNGNVTINNSAVTLAKMANLSQYQLIGRSGAGAGTPQAITTSADVYTALGSADNAAIRTNIGLGNASVQNVGTSGANVPLLNANNTFSGTATFSNANGVTTNVITERTSAAGVTADGVLLKDSGVTASSLIRNTYQANVNVFDTPLPSTDLNTVITPGNYRVSAAAVTNGMPSWLGTPPPEFGLTVEALATSFNGSLSPSYSQEAVALGGTAHTPRQMMQRFSADAGGAWNVWSHTKMISNFYAPIPVGVTNIASVSINSANWYADGNTMNISGRLTAAFTAANTYSRIDIPLPFAKSFSNNYDVKGILAYTQTQAVRETVGAMIADTTNNRLRCEIQNPKNTATQDFNFMATYSLV